MEAATALINPFPSDVRSAFDAYIRSPTPDFKHPEPRYVVPKSEAFNTITNQHLQLLYAGKNKTWEAVQQKFYGIKRADVEFVVKCCKNCALNRPVATKAPLVPIVTNRAWERV
ncbi:hypothetical protein QQS21_010605 [Conoideocrella luteorostrata]|uniref:Integrase zinc-binding domain-containing protein n=1 Tax=Conoideocrella luteorostrata TaxID=1105319 RepID=A0AAJ0CH05_9HYPO|nr:hypothetical protein QQS21_010605 [Conoideocrella luteorostrata]